MNERQKAFADYYIETGNAYESAIKAGYSEAYAKGQSYLLLDNQGIKKHIQERLAVKDAARIASQDEVLQFLTSVMRGEIPDQLGLETSVKDRSRAGELLGKRYGLFADKVDISGNMIVFKGEDKLED